MNQKNPIVDTNTNMTLTRLSQLVMAYGSHPKRWPLEEQITAAQLLETSAEARLLQQAAVSLDDLLDRVTVTPPSPQLRHRILATMESHNQPSLAMGQWLSQLLLGTTFREHIWRPAITLLIPLLLGMVMGFSLASWTNNDTWVIEEELSLLGLGTLEQQL